MMPLLLTFPQGSQLARLKRIKASLHSLTGEWRRGPSRGASARCEVRLLTVRDERVKIADGYGESAVGTIRDIDALLGALVVKKYLWARQDKPFTPEDFWDEFLTFDLGFEDD